MPVFHTKAIESILEPVAQQVSRLVIIHEEAEDGNAMPDLTVPVLAVSKAVQNLVIAGRETINNSDDPILKQDMPGSLIRVEKSYKILEEACEMLKNDPFSQPARKKLLEGASSILVGISSLLLCFDESKVRKIIKECKKVLEYLTVVEVIESINDLVQFVQDMSPCLTRVSRDVGARQKELTHNQHREILVRCLDSVKTLAPILICSMKIYAQLLPTGKKTDEAIENRNYLVSRMTDEINEIIRVLQLTTADEDEWDVDNLTAIKKAFAAILAKMQLAHDFLENPSDLVGGLGEKSLRSILYLALKIAEYCPAPVSALIKKQVSDLKAMVDALCEMRDNGNGASPQAQSMSKSINTKLKQLVQLIENTIKEMENDSLQSPKQSFESRFEQIMNWLANPGLNYNRLNVDDINSLLEEIKKLIKDYKGYPSDLLNEIKKLVFELNEVNLNSPRGKELAKKIIQKLIELKAYIKKFLLDQIAENFIDIHTPLKQFTEAVLAPLDKPGREDDFEREAENLQNFSNSAVKIARDVAKKSFCNKRISDNLLKCAADVESLCPQLINAGRIRFNHQDNKLADEHFNNLRNQYAESLKKMRNLFDEAFDTNDLIDALLKHMKSYTRVCENAIANENPNVMANNAPIIARLANRILNIARQEAENSEDPTFINKLNRAADNLQECISPMIKDATRVTENIEDPKASDDWLNTNKKLIDAAEDVRNAIVPDQSYNKYKPNLKNVSSLAPKSIGTLGDVPPPRPPPPPETDDEFEERFPSPSPNQPIMMAAHGLQQEVKDWSSKDNEIIAAAKKIALLMARLSQLVRGEGGTKKDLIDCAKAIAEASKEVSRLAKEQAKLCTDKRMRTAILQVCERIPTIGTQLSILSTVKATMLGSQASDEDREATEMLEGNAQNLMQSVKETVRTCEAASIKIRTDAGVRCIWRRKNPCKLTFK